MIDTSKQTEDWAEASFAGFIKHTKYTTYASITFLLVVDACNFEVEEDSFPAYNGGQYSPSNLNTKS